MTRSGVARGGKQCTDGQVVDGLGGKPGRELPFLDGSLPDVVIKK